MAAEDIGELEWQMWCDRLSREGLSRSRISMLTIIGRDRHGKPHATRRRIQVQHHLLDRPGLGDDEIHRLHGGLAFHEPSILVAHKRSKARAPFTRPRTGSWASGPATNEAASATGSTDISPAKYGTADSRSPADSARMRSRTEAEKWSGNQGMREPRRSWDDPDRPALRRSAGRRIGLEVSVR